ncbi:unnamed protein product [Brugia timori]|uniref:Uncharacterized protein n=1 Tax=Brugia timori TaxID=42155 RepID=A0A0R3QPI2_9BILA|nr:unnamed protein product [Brugia timori]
MNRDRRIKSAAIQILNGKQFDRSITMLCPMEIDGSENVKNKWKERLERRTRSVKNYKLYRVKE